MYLLPYLTVVIARQFQSYQHGFCCCELHDIKREYTLVMYQYLYIFDDTNRYFSWRLYDHRVYL
jgi:hypothetical protein